MIYLVLITLASFAYFGRNVLILMGWMKAPLLRKLEQYGVVDDSYTVMPELLMSFVLLLFGVTSLIIESFFRSVLPVVMVALIYITAWLMLRSRRFAQQFPFLFMALPLWYANLRERTTREERRRIAWRWLYLPARTRLAYSANDHAFQLWADLVIIGTVSHTVEDKETTAIAEGNLSETYVTFARVASGKTAPSA